MNKEDLRIVYMGTPDFAVEPLRVLHQRGFNIVGVITMPDKPAGRGHKLQQSPVKQYAVENNLPLLQPERLKDETFVAELAAWQADLQIVVAFRMLPEVVWNMPRLGTFNLHASLLPQYRGAAPINRAIMNGETETGITTFFLTHEIDTGKIIQQERIAITPTDNAGSVHDKLMYKGAEMVAETVEAIIAETITPIDQEQLIAPDGELKAAPKIFKEDCRIAWQQTAQEVYNFVRGLSPYPAAWCELVCPDGSTLSLKVYETVCIPDAPTLPTGTITTDGKSYIEAACGSGAVRLTTIQLAGKKRMATADLLRGYTIENTYLCN